MNSTEECVQMYWHISKEWYGGQAQEENMDTGMTVGTALNRLSAIFQTYTNNKKVFSLTEDLLDRLICNRRASNASN